MPSSSTSARSAGRSRSRRTTTNELLLRHARAGREVVRLKGGDPFVFGRGGEEAQLLRAAGLDFEVVPGVTAGVAAPAYAGIPVTQRAISAAVAFVTGHEDPAKPDTLIDWPALAAFPGTLVFYMGVRSLDRIATQLVAGGRPPSEPVAVVQRGTFADQRTVERHARRHRRARGRGRRASARDHGRRATSPRCTTSSHGSGPDRWPAAASRLRAPAPRPARSRRGCARSGASVVEAPAIRIEPLDATLPDLAGFDLLCVTSPNGARRLLELCRDARDLRGPAIAAIGPGTADALRAGGIEPDVVPARAVAESLVEALADRPVRRALIARAERARDVLPDALRARGAEVEILPLYRTVAEPLDDDARAAALGADYVTFTSASAVRFFVEAAGRARRPAARLDRPDHERRAARARPRAERRGDRAHARRARRGAARAAAGR